jgi:hypothetical protein
MSRISVAALVLIAVALAPGCKKKDKAGADNEATEQAAPKPTKVTESEKTNTYIECSNKFVSRAYQAKERYLSWVDPKKGPTGKESVMGTYALNGDVAQDCRAKIDRIAASEPRMPELEAAGEALTASLEVLAPLLADAAKYYDGKQAYKEDKMKHGAELHPKLMAAFDAFTKADEQMGVQLDAIEDKNLDKQLADMKNAPDRVPYLITNVIATGKKLVRAISGADGLEDIDLAVVEPAYATFEAAAVELVEYTKANKVESKIVDFARGPAPKFAFQTLDMINRKKNKTKWTSGDKVMIEGGNPSMVEGHPASVVAAYNDMIEASNRL